MTRARVLAGDFLFRRSFELMVADGSLEVLAILSRASSVIAEGEVMQLITANDTETGETAYLDVVRAKTADTVGNLGYGGTSRTFDPGMAAAGRVTIDEVDEIVAPGGIDPERVDTPGIYVQRIVMRPPGSESGVALP